MSIEELKELPDYLSVEEDVSSAIDPIARWKNQEYHLPKWSQACKYVFAASKCFQFKPRKFT